MSGRIIGFHCGPPRLIALFTVLSVVLTGCSSKSTLPEGSTSTAVMTTTGIGLETADAESAQQTTAIAFPKDFGHYTGDWDQISKRGMLRVLVLYSKSGFFYDRGRPRGVNAEAMEELEKEINKKLKTGANKFKVVLMPTTPGRMQKALDEGLGDLLCTAVIVTPERGKLVDFTIPVKTDVKLVVVTNKNSPSISGINELSGKDVYVIPSTVAKIELERLNQEFKKSSKPEIRVKEVDPNLTEEDLLEMTNAGLIPATVAVDFRAELWSNVYSDIVINSNAVLRKGVDVAWAMRKGSPQLKNILDEFITAHMTGTAFGNTVIRRYFGNGKYLKNSTSAAEMKKFESYVKYFQQYGDEYNFDYVMLAAQGYQESMLQQDHVSPRGAVGIMQVLPRYAAAKPISIPDVRTAQNNIHAGTKMLSVIAATYFNDPGIDQKNKTLFTFAAYNAGPSRIVRLRKQAQEQGLDPNKWFGNVELVASKDIGAETVQYVSNVFKYYVAYNLALEQKKIREEGRKASLGN